MSSKNATVWRLGAERLRLASVLALTTAFAGMAGCVSLPACQGGSSVQTLECSAAHGDKNAQFELGRRLETGEGFPADPARAARLYRDAGSFTSGTKFIYVPGVDHKPGWVMPVRSGPDRPGLPEAQYRLGLMYVEGRGVKPDRQQGLKLIEGAAKAGSAVAEQALQSLQANPEPR